MGAARPLGRATDPAGTKPQGGRHPSVANEAKQFSPTQLGSLSPRHRSLTQLRENRLGVGGRVLGLLVPVGVLSVALAVALAVVAPDLGSPDPSYVVAVGADRDVLAPVEGLRRSGDLGPGPGGVRGTLHMRL